MTSRKKYLDVAKFIGMFCIYLGHFGESAGNAYLFVFSFHVALFFFISGCTDSLSSDTPWYKHILKNIKSLLIPFYIFAILSLALRCISINSPSEILPSLVIILKGCVRGEFFASSLWFLTCLFVIKILFYFLRKLLRFKPLLLITATAFFIIATKLISPTIGIPSLIYNIDSACYYIIFYALGYCSFQLIDKLFAWNRLYKKILSICIGLACLAFAVFLFFSEDPLSYINGTSVIDLICSVIFPLIIIFLVLLISKLLEGVKLFSEIGENSLFLCGSEYSAKLLLLTLLQLFGLNLSFPHPLATYAYTFIVLIICSKIFVPAEKWIFKKIGLLKRIP